MIEVKEVKTKRELKAFVEFPNRLYKNNPYYCPPMAGDEMNTFIPQKNTAFDFCEAKEFLAYKDGVLVGRIAAIISYAHIKKTGKKQMRFGRFDAIDDIKVARALMEAAAAYGKEKGMEEIIGPLGFMDIDREGMLTDGYDEMNLSITIYNAPYYISLLEALGFKKDAGWKEYQLTMPDKADARIGKIADRVLERNDFHVVQFKRRKDVYPWAREAFHVVNAAFDKLYAEVPLTDRTIEVLLRQYIPMISLDYVVVVADKNDKVCGFALLVPSLAEACRKTRGHLAPFGWTRFIKALKGKNPILECYFIAVTPGLEGTGVSAILLSEELKACQKNHITTVETGPELETNEAVQSMWKGFVARQHRKRSCFKISLSELLAPQA